ncbi:hypothetical protein BDW62DRAFT_204719 [Aspergillus aurantiobrunneus]
MISSQIRRDLAAKYHAISYGIPIQELRESTTHDAPIQPPSHIPSDMFSHHDGNANNQHSSPRIPDLITFYGALLILILIVYRIAVCVVRQWRRPRAASLCSQELPTITVDASRVRKG